jgi:hypothetical protein
MAPLCSADAIKLAFIQHVEYGAVEQLLHSHPWYSMSTEATSAPSTLAMPPTQ